MKFEVKYKPSYAMLVASLGQGETMTAEAGAMWSNHALRFSGLN